jgi:hypothetical protein
VSISGVTGARTETRAHAATVRRDRAASAPASWDASAGPARPAKTALPEVAASGALLPARGASPFFARRASIPDQENAGRSARHEPAGARWPDGDAPAPNRSSRRRLRVLLTTTLPVIVAPMWRRWPKGLVVHSSGSPAAMNVSLHHTGVYQRHIHERTGGAAGRGGWQRRWKRGKRMRAVLQGGSDSRECRACTPHLP